MLYFILSQLRSALVELGLRLHWSVQQSLRLHQPLSLTLVSVLELLG